MESFAVSFYTIRPFREYVRCNSWHSRRWSIVRSDFFSLARGIIISYIFPLFHAVFAAAIFVRSLLRHIHSNQVSDAPLARDSLGVGISLWGTDCRWLVHSSIRRVDGLSISLSVSCMKLLLDFICFFVTMWPCSGCLVSFTKYSLSLCAAPPLLIGGGVIPVSKHPASLKLLLLT